MSISSGRKQGREVLVHKMCNPTTPVFLLGFWTFEHEDPERIGEGLGGKALLGLVGVLGVLFLGLRPLFFSLLLL